MSSSSLIP
jgi:hypothetical protein